MIVYNVTVNIETEVESDWLSWMKQTHIPEAVSYTHLTLPTILRV